MRLWEKGSNVDTKIVGFTVGNDPVLDRKLLVYDCKASIAHARMLARIGILKKPELARLVKGLNDIIGLAAKDKFPISSEEEDCHTAIENYLTRKYGSIGKKVHTARSRNDQVLTALRLYEKAELMEIDKLLKAYEKALDSVSYTHMTLPTIYSV